MEGLSTLNRYSAVAQAHGGGYIAAGLTIPVEGEKEKFAIRTFDESGDLVGEVYAETRLSHTEPRSVEPFDPNIVFLKDGSFIALGVQEGAEETAIYGERLSPKGEYIGDIFSIDLTRLPVVAATSEEGVALVWDQWVQGGQEGIFLKLFTKDAIPTWMPSTSPKMLVSSSSEQTGRTDASGETANSESAPSVASNAAGRGVYNPLTTGVSLLAQLWSSIFG